MLATRNQGKPTLRCRCHPTRTVVDLLSPLLLSSITWTRCLSSADASVFVFVVFVLIFLLRRLRRCRRFLGSVVYPPTHPSLSPIHRTRQASLVLCRRLCRCRLFLWPVLLCRCRHCLRQYPLPVNTPEPPPSETFTQTRFILCFLN